MELTPASVWVPSPSTTRGRSTKLGASPDGTSISYGSGRTAVIRSLTDSPSTTFGHASPVGVAKISPTGYYCASGDASGTIKVWDIKTGTVKFESKPLSSVSDVAFDGEGSRFVVVGEGREKFGAAFSLDTGAGIGEISGAAKTVNCVAMRSSRPFRAVTGSDDFSVCLSNGVPFKFASKSTRHSRFVQDVDYAPNGALYASAGSDGQVLLYDGLTGEEKGSFVDAGPNAHTGTVFALGFSKDSASVFTASADASSKLWDVESGKVVQTWRFEGDSLQSQQVGATWAGASIVSLSYSGVLNVLDPRMPTPTRTIYGHQQSISALAFSPSSRTFYSGDSSGTIRKFTTDGVCSPVAGSGHSSLVVAIEPISDGEFASTAYDDSLRTLDEKTGFTSASVSTGSIPKALTSTGNGLLYLATAKELSIIKGSEKVTTIPLDYTPTCVAVSSKNTSVAVGADTPFVHLYDSKLGHSALLELRNPITSVAFSPDDTKLAVGDSTGKVLLYDATSHQLIHARFVHQTGRVNVLKWNSTGTHLAAGSLDESIRVYSLEKPSDVISGKNTHKGGVTSLMWETDNKIVSGGADGALRSFTVSK